MFGTVPRASKDTRTHTRGPVPDPALSDFCGLQRKERPEIDSIRFAIVGHDPGGDERLPSSLNAQTAIRTLYTARPTPLAAPLADQSPVRIFISYSHKDETFLSEENGELGLYLKAVKAAGAEIWVDRQIDVGEDYLPLIKQHVSTCEIAILIISEAFLGSEFIRKFELPEISERHKRGALRLVPILFSTCGLESHRWISAKQVRPAVDRPFEGLRGNNRKKALVKIQSELCRIVREVLTDRPLRNLRKGASATQDGGEGLRGGRMILPQGYLRRRCRVIADPSPALLEFIKGLLACEASPEDNAALLRGMASLDVFERRLAHAMVAEARGVIQQMLEELEQTKLITGPKEQCRRLYRAIAREKLWKANPNYLDLAIADNAWILEQNDAPDSLRIAASFNLNVCFEKKELYEYADFSSFLADLTFQTPTGEKLWHKALVMDMIVSLKTRQVFKHRDLVQRSLNEQIETDPSGYAKTLITRNRLLRQPLSGEEFAAIRRLEPLMPANTRAAVLYQLAWDAWESNHDEFERIAISLGGLAEISDDPSVDKYHDDLKSWKR